MEAICSSETSVATQQTTLRHIPEDNTLPNHHCGNLKSYISGLLRRMRVHERPKALVIVLEERIRIAQHL
jgi:hypothetical protein